MKTPLALLLAVFLLHASLCTAGEAAPIREGASFSANDTLACGVESDADATACLDGLKWKCVPFAVRCGMARPDCGDWLVRFPTPLPVGEPWQPPAPQLAATTGRTDGRA